MLNRILELHIVLSAVTLIILGMAGLQAIVLAIQDIYLRKYKTPFMRFLPSIETLEKYLFRTLTIGWIFLSAVMLSSVVFFNFLALLSTPILLAKSILTTSAWSIFSCLLIFRYFLGWRGKIVLRGTCLGILLLLAIYGLMSTT